MIDSFINYLKFEKRASDHTITSYKNDLSKFGQFLESHNPEISISEAQHLDIRAWVVALINQKTSPRSVNRKITSLRSYYKFLQQRGYISNNPTNKVKTIKTDKNIPAFVKEQDIENFLENYQYSRDFIGLRDQLLLELLYGTGIRLSELINLKYDQINFRNKTIKVKGKGNKERVIPVYNKLLTLINNYEKEKNSYFEIQPEYFLIVTDKGKKSYPMMIYRTVKKYLDIFTTISKKSPHVLRHTFATHLLDQGADLNAIKDLLGHTSLAATQVYTHNSMEKLKAAYNKAHPKAK